MVMPDGSLCGRPVQIDFAGESVLMVERTIFRNSFQCTDPCGPPNHGQGQGCWILAVWFFRHPRRGNVAAEDIYRMIFRILRKAFQPAFLSVYSFMFSSEFFHMSAKSFELFCKALGGRPCGRFLPGRCRYQREKRCLLTSGFFQEWAEFFRLPSGHKET